MFKNKKHLLCFLIAAVLVLAGVMGFMLKTSENESITPSAAAIVTEDAVPIEEQSVNYDSFDELDEFTEDVTGLVEDDNLGKNGEFDLKRLLVLSDTDAFDVQGATDVMSFDNLYILSYDSVKATKAAYKALSKDTNIISVEADKPAEITAAVTDNKAKANADYGKQKSNVTVAVLDTGYDTKYYSGERILESAYNISGSGEENSIIDDNGHGTVMANVILDNSNANVLPLKIADNEGRTSGLRMYIGMKQAIAQKADVINISMAAYKSNSSELMDTVITEAKDAGILTVVSAGNYGEDAANYSPANAKDAITVAAVKSDKTLDKTSNYGDVVDYAAYGSLEVGGLNGEINVSDGTSVSAAIVSGIAADVIADGANTYDAIIKALDALAEDLGDTKCGRGLLGKDIVTAGNTGNQVDKVPVKSELLTCDWKSLSDEELNALIENAPEIDAKRFLDDLTEDEKKQVLSIKDCYYNGETTSLHGELDRETSNFVEGKRFNGTYLEYLYSDFFKDYVAQYSHDFVNNFDIEGGYAFYKISGKSGKVKLSVKTTNRTAPSSSSTVTFTASDNNKGGLDFSNMAYDSSSTHWVGLKNVKANKGAHIKMTGSSRTAGSDDSTASAVSREHPGDDISTNDSCNATVNVKVFISDADEEECQENDPRTYEATTSAYGTKNGTATSSTTPSTCYTQGSTVTTTPILCKHCNAQVSSSNSSTTLPFAAHTYSGTWTKLDHSEHYQDCIYYNQCSGTSNNARSRITHVHDNWTTIITKQPNCTDPGSQYRRCGTCGYEEDPTPINPLGHDWYWHAETNNGIQNGCIYVKCDRPGCNEGNPKRDDLTTNEKATTYRYRLVLDKDTHTKSVSQTPTEDWTSLSALGKTNNISGIDVNAYHAANANATVNSEPNIGYHFDHWSMSAEDEASVSWHPHNNPTSFAMPGKAITAKANSAINMSTLVVDPGFVSSYKPECSAFWEGTSDIQSFGPEKWHTTKNIPLPTRIGYDFTTWTLTSDHPNDGPGTMSTLTGPAVFTYGSDRAAESVDTLTANWKPRSDTKYVIRHWQQNINYGLGDDQSKYDVLMDDYENYYTLAETENRQGESNKVLILKDLAKPYNGFHYIAGMFNTNDGKSVQSAQATIYPDGHTEIDLFYARNRYTVTISHDGSGEVFTDSEGRNDKRNESNWFQYGDDVTVSYKPEDGWYTKYITVDGKKIERTELLPYRDSYTFPGINADHTVDVTFKIMPHINIVSKFDGDKDTVKQWNPNFIYHVEGTDYLGRHVGYNISTDKWDDIVDKRILPGEYTVTSKPESRWKIKDAFVDNFQKGEMSRDFAITVDLIDREDPQDAKKAPTSLFTYVYDVDHWIGNSDSGIVVNKLRTEK